MAEEARRIALHIAPIAAVADIGLVVIGGGIGANGDLLLEPVRAELGARLPYPPRVEVSSLGDAAVLSGALSVGLRGRPRGRLREPPRVAAAYRPTIDPKGEQCAGGTSCWELWRRRLWCSG